MPIFEMPFRATSVKENYYLTSNVYSVQLHYAESFNNNHNT